MLISESYLPCIAVKECRAGSFYRDDIGGWNDMGVTIRSIECLSLKNSIRERDKRKALEGDTVTIFLSDGLKVQGIIEGWGDGRLHLTDTKDGSTSIVPLDSIEKYKVNKRGGLSKDYFK